jgi:hypothetical protein
VPGTEKRGTGRARRDYGQRWKAETLMSVIKRKWGECLRCSGLHKSQIDFLRDSIELTKTKLAKPRSVPIQRLCNEARDSGYLLENPKTGKPITTIKTAWGKASRDAGIPYKPSQRGPSYLMSLLKSRRYSS